MSHEKQQAAILRGLSKQGQSARAVATAGGLSEDVTGQRIGGILRRFVKHGWATRQADNEFKITPLGREVQAMVNA